MKLIVNVDGGARGNPGPAAIGIVIRDGEGNVLQDLGETIGEATNNVAEYKALIRGIEMAVELGGDELEIRGDSELVVKQMLGQYKVKHADMKPLHARAKQALAGVSEWSIGHVRREQNSEADALVNQALDAIS
jgi:ribonuclease HI